MGGDIFEVNFNDDGSRTLRCNKNKRGFKVTLHIGGTDEEKKQSYEAVKNFFIHNMF